MSSRKRFPLRVLAVLLMAALFVLAIAMARSPWHGVLASPLPEPRRELPAGSASSPLPGTSSPVTLPAPLPSSASALPADLPSPVLPAASPAPRRPASAPLRSPAVTVPRAPAASAPRTQLAAPASQAQHTKPRQSAPPRTPLDLPAIATKLDPGLVNISIQLSQPGAQAVGTGIVLDPSGVVLTNNHVISGATSISVNDVGDGKTYPATVVGYDRAHDIAVIQLQGASGLKTATIGDSSKVAAGDPVAAIGNAGGRGGTPAIVAGKVTALNQTVTVLDEITGGAARLTGLIQVMAGIQPGDSGGPLANAAGEVIGVITAGTQSARGSSCATGLAIPINDAITISKQIRAGTASATVHIGPTGVLGVLVRESSPVPPGRRELPHGPRHADVPGAIIASVVPGSPSEHAGLMAGDVITSLDGMGVDSPDALVTLLIAHHPGDSVQVAWVDPAGQQHAAAVVLAEGPPS